MATKPKPPNAAQQAAVAAKMGYSDVFTNSIPELAKIRKLAAAGNWNQQRVAAAIKSTTWYKTHSDSIRTAQALAKEDPKTYAKEIAAITESVRAAGAKMGATFANPKDLATLAHDAYTFGWSQQQVNEHLSHFVTANAQGQFGGEAATVQQQLVQTMRDNGISSMQQAGLSASDIAAVEAGTADINTLEQKVRGVAASLYPPYKDRVLAGENVRDIAQPYIQTMAQTLELNANTIDLNDPALKAGLMSAPTSTTGTDGKPVVAEPQNLYDFQKSLRQDARWQQTAQAGQAAASAVTQIAQAFGHL